MNTSSIKRFGHRSVLKVKKNSPQILFVAGIVGTVATTVMASRATLKARDLVDEMTTERAAIDATAHNGGYDGDEYTAVVTEQYTLTAIEMGKLYGPTIVVGIVSVACLTQSHRQLTNRNTALTVAYTGLFNTFEKYRGRVREQMGPDVDRQLYHGVITEQREIEGKNGKTAVKSITTLDPASTAEYSVWFCDDIPSWTKDPGYNQSMLDGQEAWANWKLQTTGHLFLNEVYDLLDMPHTKVGAIVGWVHRDLGENDSFVSFGHKDDGEFTSGYTKDVMLNFNVMGSILDLI